MDLDGEVGVVGRVPPAVATSTYRDTLPFDPLVAGGRTSVRSYPSPDTILRTPVYSQTTQTVSSDTPGSTNRSGEPRTPGQSESTGVDHYVSPGRKGVGTTPRPRRQWIIRSPEGRILPGRDKMVGPGVSERGERRKGGCRVVESPGPPRRDRSHTGTHRETVHGHARGPTRGTVHEQTIVEKVGDRAPVCYLPSEVHTRNPPVSETTSWDPYPDRATRDVP